MTPPAPRPGPPGEPLDRFLRAVEDAGWKVLRREPVSAGGGVNPTRVDLSRGRAQHRLLVYSYFITHEGKGRVGNNFRVQTTRSHEGDLLQEGGRITVGVCWDPKRQVFAGFDGWAKRLEAASPSVHIKAQTLDDAAQQGWVEAPPVYDPRPAFTPANIERFLAWTTKINARRTVLLCPVDYSIDEDGERAEIVGDVWRGQPSPWVRPGDRIVLIDDRRQMLNPTLWTVVDLKTRRAVKKVNKRTNIVFRCERSGRVEDPAALDELR